MTTTTNASTKPVAGKSVSDRLLDPDPAVQQAALDEIHRYLSKPQQDAAGNPIPIRVEIWWVRNLEKVKRYDDADALAMSGLMHDLGNPETIGMFQAERVKSLLGARKPDLALSAAKQYYNICPMRQTSDAIDQIALCLINARPEERGIARKFRAQQVAGASTTQPAATQPTTAADNILKSITIDPAPYESTVKSFGMGGFETLIIKGNVLLLADRCDEARNCFENAVDLAKEQGQLTSATEGVARAIRAQTGSIGPANAYIISQRQGN